LIRPDLTAGQRAKLAARRAYEAVRPETKHSDDWGDQASALHVPF